MDLSQYIPVIATNTGTTATYTEEIATNTLNSDNKLATISGDTTQIVADNNTIIGLLQDILLELRGTQT